MKKGVLYCLKNKSCCNGKANNTFGSGHECAEDNVLEKTACSRDCQCCEKTKQRSPQEYKRLINRLNRIAGQISGIKGMVEKDAYCTDILIQVAAVNAALNSFNKELLACHIRSCVADNIRNGNDEVIDELVQTLQKLMK